MELFASKVSQNSSLFLKTAPCDAGVGRQVFLITTIICRKHEGLSHVILHFFIYLFCTVGRVTVALCVDVMGMTVNMIIITLTVIFHFPFPTESPPSRGGSVTALCFYENHDLLLVGYEYGLLELWRNSRVIGRKQVKKCKQNAK